MLSRKKNKPNKSEGVNKSIFLAYFILACHALGACALVFVVVFFHGLMRFLPWIFFFGTALLLLSGWRFLRIMRRDGKSVGEVLADPMFANRSVELRFLGGLAQLRLGKPVAPVALSDPGPRRLLEDPALAAMRELSRLAGLYEKSLITAEEFFTAKRQLFSCFSSPVCIDQGISSDDAKQ